MELILHIGATKTGSSALQRFLADNRAALLENGILYPATGEVSGGHHVLAAATHPGAHNMHKDALPRDREERFTLFHDMIAEIRAAAEENACRTIILSSEYLWGIFHNRVYKEWKTALKGMTPRVYTVIRRPDYWVQSSYIQAVKHGEHRAFDEWLELKEGNKTFGIDFPGVVETWHARLLPQEFRVRAYEWLLNHGNHYTDLLDMAGFSGDADALSYPDKAVNPSPGPEELERLLEVNRSDMDPKLKATERRKIMRSMNAREIGSSLNIIPDTQVDCILTQYGGGYQDLIAHYGVDL